MNTEEQTPNTEAPAIETAKVAPAAFPKKKTKPASDKPVRSKVAADGKVKTVAKKKSMVALSPVGKALRKIVAAPAKKPAKPAAKKTAPATDTKAVVKAIAKRGVTKQGYRTDYKAGERVKVWRTNGNVERGEVHSVFHKPTGSFVRVNLNTGTKKVPLIQTVTFRPSMVEAI